MQKKFCEFPPWGQFHQHACAPQMLANALGLKLLYHQHYYAQLYQYIQLEDMPNIYTVSVRSTGTKAVNLTLMKLTPGIHFTNMFTRRFYAHRSQKPNWPITLLSFLHFWDLCLQKLLIKRWWNWHLKWFHKFSFDCDAGLDVNAIVDVNRHVRILPQKSGQIELSKWTRGKKAITSGLPGPNKTKKAKLGKEKDKIFKRKAK